MLHRSHGVTSTAAKRSGEVRRLQVQLLCLAGKTQVSPLRRTVRLSCSGRDDSSGWMTASQGGK